MSTTEIQDIWQAIRESEQSDEIQLRDDALLIEAKAPPALPQRQELFGSRGSGAGQKMVVDATLSPTLP